MTTANRSNTIRNRRRDITNALVILAVAIAVLIWGVLDGQHIETLF